MLTPPLRWTNDNEDLIIMAITIPQFTEDRGPMKVDPKTGSTLNQPISFCKDLKGCGDPTYSVVSGAISVNGVDEDCAPVFKGSASVSVTAGPNESWTEAKKLIDAVVAELQNAFTSCSQQP